MMVTAQSRKKARDLTMSKYTTEVRFICEEAAGLKQSVGYNDVNDVVQQAYPKIFDSSLVFHNEETKARLLPKILIHYYTREIGFETVGLWKLKLNQKLREILPYYNQLYASEELEYDPLQNVSNTHTHSGNYQDSRGGSNQTLENKLETRNTKEERDLAEIRDMTETRDLMESKDKLETRNLTTTDDGVSSYDHNEDTLLKHTKTTAQNDDTIIHSVDDARDHWVMFSDTPQGGIDGVQLAGGAGSAGTTMDNAYLTNVTHETDAPAATRDKTEHGTITETYNLGANNKDNVHSDGSDSASNTNKQTGDVTEAGTTANTGNINTAGSVANVGNIANTGTVSNDNAIIHEKNEQDAGTEEYTKTETGKIGVVTYQEMQMRWRESFLNIDMQIIDELGDLFMKVW